MSTQQTSPSVYTPPGCQRLSEVKHIPQIRLGLQGYGNTGKTWASLTFPNPIVANLDRGLGAHVGRADVMEIPFYSAAFCKSIDPNYTPASKKDLLLTWLEKHGSKLTPDQTLVWDGNTPTQNAYHVWFEANKHRFIGSSGKPNEFAEWREKVSYYSTLFDILKTLPCHVVFICHEVEKKEAGGRYDGKVRPLLTGQMGDELVTHFTDWFRAQCVEKPKDLGTMTPEKLAAWGCKTGAEFKANVCDMFKNDVIYFWQTQGDAIFDAKASSLVDAPRFIPASFKSFEKYRRK